MSALRQRRRFGDVVLRPHVLVGVLLLLAAAAWFVGGLRGVSVPRAPDLLVDADASGGASVRDAAIVVVDREGLSRTVVVEVRSSDAFEARLAAALAALRGTLIEAGIWPERVAAPTVLSYELQRRRVVVVDVPGLEGGGVDVLRELAVLRSLEETAFAHGADEVRVVVDGAPATTLWGQVALR